MVPADSADVKADYDVLLNELKKYNPELMDKDRILAITKCDLADEDKINVRQSAIRTTQLITFFMIKTPVFSFLL